jgi:UDP:flavonoid glycosyltransferase YjiC (YdhE family)
VYALFTAIPFVGHINPLVRQAEALRRRGWRTATAVHRELAAHVARESEGTTVVDLGALGPLRARMQRLEAAASADPSYTRGALRLAPLLFEPWPSTYDALRASVLRDAPILVDAVFGVEYRRPLSPNVQMVGPMLAPVTPIEADLASWLRDGAPVVYANLGTVARPAASQLAAMAEAFASDARRVLWVVRDASRDQLPRRLPPNVRSVGWIESPRAVLAHPNVQACVSHCGMNSVYESLAGGTPIVGIPMLSDQRDMAVHVSDAGLGVWCDKTRFTADELRSAIARVCEDESFRWRAAAIREAIDATGGAARAADVIASTAAASPASVV